RISSNIPKWWRGGSRKPSRRSAAASGGSPRAIAALARLPGANGGLRRWSGSKSNRSGTAPVLPQAGFGGRKAPRKYERKVFEQDPYRDRSLHVDDAERP